MRGLGSGRGVGRRWNRMSPRRYPAFVTGLSEDTPRTKNDTRASIALAEFPPLD